MENLGKERWKAVRIMKIRLLAAVLVLWIPSLLFASESKELLARAIVVSNSINENVSVETRLERYDEIQDFISQILSRHLASEEAILISTNQSIGNFDYSRIKNQHLKELTNYYGKVCRFSPSLDCLAVISLQGGVTACRAAGDFKSISLAHKSIGNSLKIFYAQDEKVGVKNLALNAYNGCLSDSKLSLGPSLKDHFGGQLVTLLLEVGENDAARAVIENMTNEYQKFYSVFDFRRASNGEIDKAFLMRMSKFAVEELEWKDKVLAGLKLKLELLKTEISELDKKDTEQTYNILGRVPGGSDSDLLNCDIVFTRNLFYAATQVTRQMSIVLDQDRFNYPAESKASSRFRKNRYVYNAFESLHDFLNGCAQPSYLYQTDGRHYGTAFTIHNTLLRYGDPDSFVRYAESVNFDSDRLQEWAYNVSKDNPRVTFPRKIYSDIYRFKLDVETDFCRAIDNLFTKMIDKSEFNDAVAFLLDSPLLYSQPKDSCGDSELELLLN